VNHGGPRGPSENRKAVLNVSIRTAFLYAGLYLRTGYIFRLEALWTSFYLKLHFSAFL
jgi:hypothetical protein